MPTSWTRLHRHRGDSREYGSGPCWRCPSRWVCGRHPAHGKRRPDPQRRGANRRRRADHATQIALASAPTAPPTSPPTTAPTSPPTVAPTAPPTPVLASAPTTPPTSAPALHRPRCPRLHQLRPRLPYRLQHPRLSQHHRPRLARLRHRPPHRRHPPRLPADPPTGRAGRCSDHGSCDPPVAATGPAARRDLCHRRRGLAQRCGVLRLLGHRRLSPGAAQRGQFVAITAPASPAVTDGSVTVCSASWPGP